MRRRTGLGLAGVLVLASAACSLPFTSGQQPTPDSAKLPQSLCGMLGKDEKAGSGNYRTFSSTQNQDIPGIVGKYAAIPHSKPGTVLVFQEDTLRDNESSLTEMIERNYPGASYNLTALTVNANGGLHPYKDVNFQIRDLAVQKGKTYLVPYTTMTVEEYERQCVPSNPKPKFSIAECGLVGVSFDEVYWQLGKENPHDPGRPLFVDDYLQGPVLAHRTMDFIIVFGQEPLSNSPGRTLREVIAKRIEGGASLNLYRATEKLNSGAQQVFAFESLSKDTGVLAGGMWIVPTDIYTREQYVRACNQPILP